ASLNSRASSAIFFLSLARRAGVVAGRRDLFTVLCRPIFGRLTRFFATLPPNSTKSLRLVESPFVALPWSRHRRLLRPDPTPCLESRKCVRQGRLPPATFYRLLKCRSA